MIVWLITWSLDDERSIAEANILWFHVVSKLISFWTNDRSTQLFCKPQIHSNLQVYHIYNPTKGVIYTTQLYELTLCQKRGGLLGKMATKPETIVQDSVLTFDPCIFHWEFQPLPSVKPRDVKTYSSCAGSNKSRIFRWDDEFVCGDRPRLAKTCSFSDPNRVVFVPRPQPRHNIKIATLRNSHFQHVRGLQKHTLQKRACDGHFSTFCNISNN